MKQIYIGFFILLMTTAITLGQTADLLLSYPESGTQLHQATNSITFLPGYSYTPGGNGMIAEIVEGGGSALVGDTQQNPIIAGTFSDSFEYSATPNTINFTNTYNRPTNDVFYKFTITGKMNVMIRQVSSVESISYLEIWDEEGGVLESKYPSSGSIGYYVYRTFDPGTYYLMAEGYSKNGEISILIAGSFDEFNYPNSPNYYSSDPDAVGATSGNLAVSETGGATVNIPIKVPVGIGGMQPNLSIVYNSQAGNGVVGWGANLTSISAITRTPKSIYYDGNAKGLTYLGDDAYLLDGKRLIYSYGTAGQEGAVYYPESDPFTKVTVHGTYSGSVCNTWFEVQSKDGLIYTYGSTSADRQTISGSKVTAWYLDKVEDPLGNYMEYNYFSYYYYVYLSSISYGKNSNQSGSFENKVEFTYEYRSDQTPFILDGTKGLMYYRLSGIKTKTGSSVFREYQLQYVNSDIYSRLASVTEKNGNGETLKPIQLNWNYLPSFYQSSYTTSVTAAAASYGDYDYTVGDYNGDGITDIACIREYPYNTSYNCIELYHGKVINGTVSFVSDYNYSSRTFAKSYYFRDWKTIMGNFYSPDFDGDGKADLYIPEHVDVTGIKQFQFRFFTGALAGGGFGYNYVATPDYPVLAHGDIERNGKDDIVIIEKNQSNGKYPGSIIGLGSGTSLTSMPFDFELSSKPEKMFVADFNGNGLSDVIIFYNGGYKIFWNQGYGISTSTLSNSNVYSSSTIEDNWMIRMGDFNGDGLPDFIMNESGGGNSGNSSWYFALNNGNGTFSKYLACSIPVFDQTFTDKDNGRFDCQVLDLDLDGKSDVVIQKAMYDKHDDMLSSPWGVYRETHTYWMRSTGTTLSQVSYAHSTNEEDAKILVTGDFNGDGKADLINYGYNCYNGSSTTQSWRYYKNPYLYTKSGMIASVTSGMGGTSSVSYDLLTNSDFYTKGTGATYPLMDVTPPMAAVNAVSYDNGVAGTINETYSYKGAKVHLQGKGFLGFMATIANNTTKGIVSETGTTSINTTWFAPTQTYSRTTVDGHTATTTVDYTYVDKGSKKFFAYPNTKTDTDLDGNTNTTDYDYNETYGYITDEKTEYGSTAMYKKAEYRSYTLAGGRYQPQLINAIQKHPDDSQEFIQKTALTYDATKGYPKTKVENYGTALALTTEYLDYDDFGSLKQSKVSGDGVPALITYTNFDATNRFPAKVYTSPASTVASYTYDTWGNPLTEKDETNSANILETSHAYDDWGLRTSTTLPDGRKTVYKQGWNNDTQKRYFSLVMGGGQPWIKQWYDRAGHETVTETIGPKGMAVSTTKNYDNEGQLESTESQQGSLTITESFQYDARGRMTSQSSNSGQSATISYDNRKVTTTRNGQDYAKTYDAWGNLVLSEDPLADVSYTYRSVGKPMSITTGGATFTMDYDAAGNQKQLVDPNAGTINYTYDAAGRLHTQDDARSKHLEVVYDAQGRIDYSELAGTTTDYEYGTTGYDLNKLTKITTGSNYLSYNYDQYGRVQTEKRQIDGAGLLIYGYDYNDNSLLKTTTYPGGVQVGRTYDASGNLETVTAGGQTVWALTSVTGTVTTTSLGGTMTATSTLDSQGLLSELKTLKGSTVVRDLDYLFDGATGNLTWRTGMLAHKENFFYDNLDRLESVTNATTGTEILGVEFDVNGNIDWKTGLGEYGYNGSRPHALTDVDNTDGLIQLKGQHIDYTDFNKAYLLKDTLGTDAYKLDITYGPDQQRCLSVLKKNGTTVKTTVFGGEYEKITLNGVTRELYYIGGGDGLAAVYVKQSGQSDKIYYAHTDHLGSILSLTDNNGASVFKATYDAWGRQTVSQNTIGFARGYTGHEHLPEFGVIDMNGRMYDPLLGRFLSPDPYVQMPDYSQNFNRYAYCFNNPLIYTDPSGEFLIEAIIFGAIMNTFMQGASGNINSSGDFFKAMGIGALAGAAGYGAGQLVAGAVGTIGFTGGALTGAAGGFAGGFVGGAGNAWASGASFGQGLGQGLIGGGFGAVAGGLIGGISGGVTATRHGGKFWSGEGAIFESPAAVGLTPENVKVGEGMEYTTKYANSVADDTYGKLSYVERIATNEVPVGEDYTLNNGCIINKHGRMANGLTRYLGKGNSEVYLGKSAFTSVGQLKITIGHEYIHATQNYMAFKKVIANVNETYSGYPMAEIAAHNWESTMGVSNSFGEWTGKLRAWSWSRQPYYNWLLNAKF